MTVGSDRVVATSRRWAPRVAPSGALDARSWDHVAGPFRALAHTFTVRSEDADFGRALEASLRDLASLGPASTTYSLLDRGEVRDGRRRYALYADDDRLGFVPTPNRAAGLLQWQLNQSAIDSMASTHVVLHAAAAERGGRVVVLPAPMESGKTTTVAGLVRAGFGYLTDEATAIEVDTRGGALPEADVHRLRIVVGAGRPRAARGPADRTMAVARQQRAAGRGGTRRAPEPDRLSAVHPGRADEA